MHDHALVSGDVRLGRDCVVHPLARLLATGGPVLIGDRCVVEERAVVENRCARFFIFVFQLFLIEFCIDSRMGARCGSAAIICCRPVAV